MTIFKPGDRVRTTSESYGDDVAPVGALGTVLHAIGTTWSYVAFDGDPDGDGGGGWAIGNHQIVPAGGRPWSTRVWFWKPQLHWFGWRTLIPFSRGGDEWGWHTILLGWTVTGRVIVALRRCPQSGRCAGEEPLAADWPADPYADLDLEVCV